MSAVQSLQLIRDRSCHISNCCILQHGQKDLRTDTLSFLFRHRIRLYTVSVCDRSADDFFCKCVLAHIIRAVHESISFESGKIDDVTNHRNKKYNKKVGDPCKFSISNAVFVFCLSSVVGLLRTAGLSSASFRLLFFPCHVSTSFLFLSLFRSFPLHLHGRYTVPG